MRMAEKCAKTSGPPPSGSMKPNPLALLNHLTVPNGMSPSLTLCWLIFDGARDANSLRAFINVSSRSDPEMPTMPPRWALRSRERPKQWRRPGAISRLAFTRHATTSHHGHPERANSIESVHASGAAETAAQGASRDPARRRAGCGRRRAQNGEDQASAHVSGGDVERRLHPDGVRRHGAAADLQA